MPPLPSPASNSFTRSRKSNLTCRLSALPVPVLHKYGKPYWRLAHHVAWTLSYLDSANCTGTYAGGVTNAAPVQRHLHYLSFAPRYSPFVMILHQEDLPLTAQIVAPRPLFVIRLPPVFHDRTASALGTLYCHNSHTPSSLHIIDNKGSSIPLN